MTIDITICQLRTTHASRRKYQNKADFWFSFLCLSKTVGSQTRRSETFLVYADHAVGFRSETGSITMLPELKPWWLYVCTDVHTNQNMLARAGPAACHRCCLLVASTDDRASAARRRRLLPLWLATAAMSAARETPTPAPRPSPGAQPSPGSPSVEAAMRASSANVETAISALKARMAAVDDIVRSHEGLAAAATTSAELEGDEPAGSEPGGRVHGRAGWSQSPSPSPSRVRGTINRLGDRLRTTPKRTPPGSAERVRRPGTQIYALKKARSGFGMLLSDTGVVQSYSGVRLSAEQSGLPIGAQLICVAGREVNSNQDILEAVQSLPIGETVAFEVLPPDLVLPDGPDSESAAAALPEIELHDAQDQDSIPLSSPATNRYEAAVVAALHTLDMHDVEALKAAQHVILQNLHRAPDSTVYLEQLAEIHHALTAALRSPGGRASSASGRSETSWASVRSDAEDAGEAHTLDSFGAGGDLSRDLGVESELGRGCEFDETFDAAELDEQQQQAHAEKLRALLDGGADEEGEVSMSDGGMDEEAAAAVVAPAPAHPSGSFTGIATAGQATSKLKGSVAWYSSRALDADGEPTGPPPEALEAAMQEEATHADEDECAGEDVIFDRRGVSETGLDNRPSDAIGTSLPVRPAARSEAAAVPRTMSSVTRQLAAAKSEYGVLAALEADERAAAGMTPGRCDMSSDSDHFLGGTPRDAEDSVCSLGPTPQEGEEELSEDDVMASSPIEVMKPPRMEPPRMEPPPGGGAMECTRSAGCTCQQCDISAAAVAAAAMPPQQSVTIAGAIDDEALHLIPQAQNGLHSEEEEDEEAEQAIQRSPEVAAAVVAAEQAENAALRAELSMLKAALELERSPKMSPKMEAVSTAEERPSVAANSSGVRYARPHFS